MIKSKNIDGFKKLLTEYYTECANCETYPNVKSINEKWERYQRDSEVWISLDTESVWASVAYGLRRKPRTQMINGHEVVVPRYDTPTNKDELIFILAPLELCGFDDVAWGFLDDHQKKAILKYGWFDNSDDAENYANAHRENKND